MNGNLVIAMLIVLALLIFIAKLSDQRPYVHWPDIDNKPYYIDNHEVRKQILRTMMSDLAVLPGVWIEGSTLNSQIHFQDFHCGDIQIELGLLTHDADRFLSLIPRNRYDVFNVDVYGYRRIEVREHKSQLQAIVRIYKISSDGFIYELTPWGTNNPISKKALIPTYPTEMAGVKCFVPRLEHQWLKRFKIHDSIMCDQGCLND